MAIINILNRQELPPTRYCAFQEKWFGRWYVCSVDKLQDSKNYLQAIYEWECGITEWPGGLPYYLRAIEHPRNLTFVDPVLTIEEYP